MKKYGGFIPGIRAGRPTAEYLDYVLTRITVPGALYLAESPHPAIARGGRGEPELPVRRHVDPHHRRRRPRDREADPGSAPAAALRRVLAVKRLIDQGPPVRARGRRPSASPSGSEIPAISTGDIFRNNIKDGTDLGKRVEAILKSGGYVPDEMTNAVIQDRLGWAGRGAWLPPRRVPTHARPGRLPRPGARGARPRPRRGDRA